APTLFLLREAVCATTFCLGASDGAMSALAVTPKDAPSLVLVVASPKAASALPPAVVTLTLAVPALIMPMLAAAAFDKSMIRPPINGPRSLIRTTTDRPLDRFSTSTLVPKGNERCAAVSSLGFICSPFAVMFAGSEYQEAWPSWSALA